MELKIEHITKSYGGVKALDDYSITFREGIYGILGPNGAGKSTLMNLITDNCEREEGQILFDGTDILKLGKHFRRAMGFMPQQQGFYEQMTVNAFLAYMAELKEVPRGTAKEQIEKLLALMNLSGDCHKKMGGLSGGMRQRVLLAQAFLGDPRVVILDEPTAGLDPKERIRIRNVISSFAQERIILLATHIVSDIESISDTILLMRGGRIVRAGTPEELLDSVKDKVWEVPWGSEEREQGMPEKESAGNTGELSVSIGGYKVGNIRRREGRILVRLVGETMPAEGLPMGEHVSLEDVYLYYLEDKD